ncbi:MAG: capsule assembly Wzi family protein [Balneolales bacterium]
MQLSAVTTLIILLSGCLHIMEAQPEKRPDLRVGLNITGGMPGDIPFWLLANRNGIPGSGRSAAYLRISADTPLHPDRLLDYAAGFDLIGRQDGQNSAWFNQLYLHVRYGPVRIYGGRIKEAHGMHDPWLSSGSLGWSHNATPMPKIGLRIPDWLSVPYTKDFIAVRGHIAHGWFGDNRYTARPWLHEKSGYVKLGGQNIFNVYGGLMHYTVWGGEHPELGNLPGKFTDFKRVFLVKSGHENAPPGEDDYMLGDHLGAWDAGFMINLGRFHTSVYRQFPLETKDNLKLKSPQDGLLGISIASANQQSLLSAITYEFLYTKWQDGPRRPDPGNFRDGEKGNENYYNHFLYRSGWTYFGRTLGNPLFFPRDDGPGIENNRIVAHHLGAGGAISPAFSYRTLITYSRNYGTYGTVEEPRGEDYPYYHGLTQFSFLLETQTLLPYLSDLYFNAAFAADTGQLYSNNAGVWLGIQKVIR